MKKNQMKSKLQKNLLKVVFLLGFLITGSNSSFASLPNCTLDNGITESDLIACIPLIPPRGIRNNAQAVNQVGRRSLEIQFFNTERSDGRFFRVLLHSRECLSMPQYPRVQQPTGHAPICEITKMVTRNYNFTRNHVEVLYTSKVHALLTGNGSGSGITDGMPSVPAAIASFTSVEGMIWMVRGIVKRVDIYHGRNPRTIMSWGHMMFEFFTDLSRYARAEIFPRIMTRFRPGYLNPANLTRARIPRGGASGLTNIMSYAFVLFLAEPYILGKFYDLFKNHFNSFDRTVEYANILSAMLPRLESCAANNESCFDLELTTNTLLEGIRVGRNAESFDNYLNTNDTGSLSSDLEGIEEDMNSAEAQDTAFEPAIAGSPRRDPLRIADFDKVLAAFQALGRPACSTPGDTSSCRTLTPQGVAFFRTPVDIDIRRNRHTHR